MCGRLDQHHNVQDYIDAMEWRATIRSEAPSLYNAPPGTLRPVLLGSSDDMTVDDLHWGYKPFWAKGKMEVKNARRDKLLGGYWKRMLTNPRGIVLVDGWYEWTGPKGGKTPWHIHKTDKSPILLAALTTIEPDHPHTEEGFVIVTDDALGGMVDVHDRRPVALSKKGAEIWLNEPMSPEEAEQLLATEALSPENFKWYEVDKGVNNSRNESPKFAEPWHDEQH